MGTYTYHTLTVIIEECDKHKYSEKEIISQLRSEYWEAMEAIDEDGNTENEAKWYKSDDDMLEFSKKYPSIVFKLTQSPAQGDEDERDCECDFYYKNGEEFFDELEEFTTEIFIENIQSQRNIGQGATGTSPIKTKWEVWMEKSIAARNQR